jgi:PAS domain S-box-containing protein
MTKDRRTLIRPVELRSKAEELARKNTAKSTEKIQALSLKEIEGLLHELRVHQIELEMQNEELLRAQTKLQASRECFQDLYDFAPAGYCTVSEQGLILKINLTATTLLGVPRSQLFRKMLTSYILPEDQDIYYRHHKALFATGEPQVCEMRLIRADKSLFWARLEAIAVMDKDGTTTYRIVLSDITKQRKLEENLFQSHKMEAIGTLAGGVAHDFNNILSAIIGFSELAKDSIPPENSAQEYIDIVLKSSMRAADLVEQILTFSCKSPHVLQSFMPHLIVKEAMKMMRASLPATLSLEEKIDIDCGLILADPTNIHQIVANLCTNAFHATENEKGTLTVSLYRKELAAEDIKESDILPGPFVVLSVSDTGCGMDKKTIGRIFEPYFSTKEVSKGTGLGLAVILGIVKDYKGFIEVESEPGKGSAFRVYLPALQKVVSTPKIEAKKSLPTGTERILVVDDESEICNLEKTILELLGYTVTATKDSRQALEKISSSPDDFDLLITDQTMPYLSGTELAKEVLKIRPNMQIILCTGYSSAITEEGALAIGIKKYAIKPVNRSTLATLAREVLDGKG